MPVVGHCDFFVQVGVVGETSVVVARIVAVVARVLVRFRARARLAARVNIVAKLPQSSQSKVRRNIGAVTILNKAHINLNIVRHRRVMQQHRRSRSRRRPKLGIHPSVPLRGIRAAHVVRRHRMEPSKRPKGSHSRKKLHPT